MKLKTFSSFIYSFAMVVSVGNMQGQIGAEAQGGKATLWTALGFDQELSEHWTSVSDVGYGRHSDPSNYSLVKRQGLNVITQDFMYKPASHWQFAFSIGYWRRNFYSDAAPYDERLKPYEFRNELRPYQRIYYNHKIKKISVSHSLRTDYRFYYDQNFRAAWTTPFEFRARYMEKWKFPLSENMLNWFIVIDEVLSAIDQYSKSTGLATGKQWSPYQFTENRLSVYYRRSLFNKRVDFDIGVMHQYWREKPGVSTFNTSYNLMFDLIFRNPFGKK